MVQSLNQTKLVTGSPVFQSDCQSGQILITMFLRTIEVRSAKSHDILILMLNYPRKERGNHFYSPTLLEGNHILLILIQKCNNLHIEILEHHQDNFDNYEIQK